MHLCITLGHQAGCLDQHVDEAWMRSTSQSWNSWAGRDYNPEALDGRKQQPYMLPRPLTDALIIGFLSLHFAHVVLITYGLFLPFSSPETIILPPSLLGALLLTSLWSLCKVWSSRVCHVCLGGKVGLAG